MLKRIKDFIQFLIEEFKDRSILNYAAQMTYGALLAFTPLLMLFFNILSFFAVDNGRLIAELENIIPSFLVPLILTAAKNAQNPYHSIFSNILYGFFIIWFSVYFLRLFILVNTKVMGIKETRPIVRSYILSAGYLLMVIFMVLILIGCFYLLRFFMVAILRRIGIYAVIGNYWQILSVFIFASLLIIMMTVLYMISPPKRMPFLTAVPGSVFVGFSWLFITLIAKRILSGIIDAATITRSFEWPFVVVITVFLACFVMVFGMVINMYFVRIGRTHYEV